MSPLPYLGIAPDTIDWTSAQKHAWIWCAYLIITSLILTAVITILNLLQFICEGKCNRWYYTIKHPLIVFYILTIALLIYDIFGVLFFLEVPIVGNWMIFFMDMPPILKALIGVEQIWMMVELSLRIRAKFDFEKKITYGRVIVLIFEGAFLLFWLIYNTVFKATTKEGEVGVD